MRTAVDLIRELVRIANQSQTVSDPAEVQREQAKLGALILEAEEWLKTVDEGGMS